MAQYVADSPLSGTLALEAALGKDLSAVQGAIIDAKARLVELRARTGEIGVEAVISDAIGRKSSLSVCTSGSVRLPEPTLEDIMLAPAPKWHRTPLAGEVFLANRETKKLHSTRPPSTASPDNPFDDVRARLRESKAVAWCGYDGWTSGTAAVFAEQAGRLCEKCYGKQACAGSASSTDSSFSESE